MLCARLVLNVLRQLCEDFVENTPLASPSPDPDAGPGGLFSSSVADLMRFDRAIFGEDSCLQSKVCHRQCSSWRNPANVFPLGVLCAPAPKRTMEGIRPHESTTYWACLGC